jgi:hypothetical protein
MYAAVLLLPERLRTVERPFGWAPFQLVTSGLLARLSVGAKALYLALCLVADRQGLSFWGGPRLQTLVGLSEDELCTVRQELIERDLLAFDGRVYQLLSLPNKARRIRVTAGRTTDGRNNGPHHVGSMLDQNLRR